MARGFLSAPPGNLFLGLEDIGYIDERTEEEVCSWKPVYASLTWNGANSLAGGCMSNAGLSKRGRRAAEFLSVRGICIDCAHLNTESFRELLGCKVFGLVDSHTCLNAVCSHPRNLDDWQVREIAARNGLVGIAFVGAFLRSGGPACADDVFRHIDYGVQKFGIDFFCLGSDFNGTNDLPQGLRSYMDIGRLQECFIRAGYSAGDIKKIFAENLQNFLLKRH